MFTAKFAIHFNKMACYNYDIIIFLTNMRWQTIWKNMYCAHSVITVKKIKNELLHGPSSVYIMSFILGKIAIRQASVY